MKRNSGSDISCIFPNMKFCWNVLLFIYQVLSRLSFISALGMMTRITSQVNSFQTTELLTFVVAGEVMAGEWRALSDSPLICALARQNRPLRRRQIVGFVFFSFFDFLVITHSLHIATSFSWRLHAFLAKPTKSKAVFRRSVLWSHTVSHYALFRASSVKSLFARIQEW